MTDFVTETSYFSLPEIVIRATKRVILDTIAVAVGAYDTPVTRALLRLKGDQGGREESTLFVDGRKVPAPSAAYVHAQMANLLDADDTLLNRSHLACSSVMTGLAVAEKANRNGRDLIAAVATGYDITARVGCSLQQFTIDEDGAVEFAPLFGFGWMAMGAAVTAGRLLDLDNVQIGRAIGQAFVTAPISFDIGRAYAPCYQAGPPANWHKYQLAGPASESGINAALLAAEGFVAQGDILDESTEFWRSFGAGGCDWGLLYGDIGERWFIAETSLKSFPFNRFAQVALDLLSAILSEDGIREDEIERITIRVPPFANVEAMAKNGEVDDPLKLMVSLPTACALIARGVAPGPAWWKADLTETSLTKLKERVAVQLVPEWSQVMREQLEDTFVRRIPTEVSVLARRRIFVKFDEYAIGDPWGSGHDMSDERLAKKVHEFTADHLSTNQAEQLIEAVLHLETSSDVSEITRAVSP